MGSSRGREDAMDRILGWSLLPTDVRLQNPITPSQIYGPVHLIRMFGKIIKLLITNFNCDNGEHLYSPFPHICAQRALTLIITLKDQESRPYLILSQLPRNNDNNVKNNNTPRKHYSPAAC